MGMKYGGPREDRTPNPLIKSQLLCQLSYRPALFLPNRAKKLNTFFDFSPRREKKIPPLAAL